MPCYHPVPARQEPPRKAFMDGAHIVVPGAVVLHPQLGTANMSVPCGRCLGCKSRRGQEWAARVLHELRNHDAAIFATLTYAPEHLPSSGELVPRDLSLFLKRLRQAMARRRGRSPDIRGHRLRYLACGEYGDIGGRPHYHAILFGVGFNDEQTATATLKTSPTLTRLWGKGTVNYGEVTAASAAYVAGYTIKKIGRTHCDADGVVMEAPFLRASTHPGLGADYANRYAADFRGGATYVDGHPHPLPRYYRKLLAQREDGLADEAAQAIYDRNIERVKRDPIGSAPERLVAAEVIHERRMQLTRHRTL